MEQSPRRQIRPFRPGMRKIPSSRLNAVVEYVNEQNRGIAPPSQVANPIPQQNATFRRLRIARLFGTYLECVEATNPDSAIYLVAKPDDLRTTYLEHDGVTFSYVGSNERNANDGTTAEAQILTPRYLAEDVLTCVSPVLGGTGVVVEGEDVVWLDLNVTGRQWAVEDA